jgi:hypothetical protein
VSAYIRFFILLALSRGYFEAIFPYFSRAYGIIIYMSGSESGEQISLSEQSKPNPKQKIINYLSDPERGAIRRETFSDYAILQRLSSRSLKVKESVINLDRHKKLIDEKKKPGSEYEAEFNGMDDLTHDFKSWILSRRSLNDSYLDSKMSDSEIQATKQFKFATELQDLSQEMERKI